MQETLLITENYQEQQDKAHVKENINGWIIQILYWISVYGGFALVSTFNESAFIIPLYILYLFHIFNAIYCSTNTYLRSIDNDNVTLSSKLSEFFTASPTITSKVKSYHYQNNKKIITSEDISQYPYYSSRDISGLFKINPLGKSYVMLELKKIYFADPLSYSDYINGKNALWLKNNGKDQQMGYYEIDPFINYKQYHLLRIDGQKKYFVVLWFILDNSLYGIRTNLLFLC